MSETASRRVISAVLVALLAIVLLGELSRHIWFWYALIVLAVVAVVVAVDVGSAWEDRPPKPPKSQAAALETVGSSVGARNFVRQLDEDECLMVIELMADDTEREHCLSLMASSINDYSDVFESTVSILTSRHKCLTLAPPEHHHRAEVLAEVTQSLDETLRKAALGDEMMSPRDFATWSRKHAVSTAKATAGGLEKQASKAEYLDDYIEHLSDIRQGRHV